MEKLCSNGNSKRCVYHIFIFDACVVTHVKSKHVSDLLLIVFFPLLTACFSLIWNVSNTYKGEPFTNIYYWSYCLFRQMADIYADFIAAHKTFAHFQSFHFRYFAINQSQPTDCLTDDLCELDQLLDIAQVNSIFRMFISDPRPNGYTTECLCTWFGLNFENICSYKGSGTESIICSDSCIIHKPRSSIWSWIDDSTYTTLIHVYAHKKSRAYAWLNCP